MRVPAGLLPLGSALITGVLLPGVSGSVAGWRNDAQALVYYEKVGKCFGYVKEADYDFVKAQAPCSKWCRNTGSDSAECPQPWMIGGSTPGSTIKDDKGGEFIPSTCKCHHDLEVTKMILEETLEGLENLDKFHCTIALSAVQEIVQVGIHFVPGPNVVGVVSKTVRAAKTFAENGLDGASFFSNWIGSACGTPDYDFSIEDAFSNLQQMPDELGRGQGCKQRRFKWACDVKGAPAKTPKRELEVARKPNGHPTPVSPPEKNKPANLLKKPVPKPSPKKSAPKPSPQKPAPKPSPKKPVPKPSPKKPAPKPSPTDSSACEKLSKRAYECGEVFNPAENGYKFAETASKSAVEIQTKDKSFLIDKLALTNDVTMKIFTASNSDEKDREGRLALGQILLGTYKFFYGKQPQDLKTVIWDSVMETDTLPLLIRLSEGRKNTFLKPHEAAFKEVMSTAPGKSMNNMVQGHIELQGKTITELKIVHDPRGHLELWFTIG